MASTWGENIKLSIFGGSHTEAIGVVLDNLPQMKNVKSSINMLLWCNVRKTRSFW